MLGTMLDSRLTMGEHGLKVAASAICKCMELRRITGVRSARMRQLYTAAVVPTKNYAPSTWYAPARPATKRHIAVLEKVQRPAARLILRAYKSVALLVL